MKIACVATNNDATRRTIEERTNEITSLDDKMQRLGLEVNECRSVKLSRDEARGAMSDPANIAAMKMKKVVRRRHMVDVARAQAEEIDFLRTELDKMRQRTFPSFVKATKNRIRTQNQG